MGGAPSGRTSYKKRKLNELSSDEPDDMEDGMVQLAQDNVDLRQKFAVAEGKLTLILQTNGQRDDKKY